MRIDPRLRVVGEPRAGRRCPGSPGRAARDRDAPLSQGGGLTAGNAGARA